MGGLLGGGEGGRGEGAVRHAGAERFLTIGGSERRAAFAPAAPVRAGPAPGPHTTPVMPWSITVFCSCSLSMSTLTNTACAVDGRQASAFVRVSCVLCVCRGRVCLRAPPQLFS